MRLAPLQGAVTATYSPRTIVHNIRPRERPMERLVHALTPTGSSCGTYRASGLWVLLPSTVVETRSRSFPDRILKNHVKRMYGLTTRVAGLICGLILMFPLSSFSAQNQARNSSINDSVRTKIERDKMDRLTGWERIVFLCSPPPQSPQKELLERICERTNTNLKFLAATTNAKAQIAKNAINLGELSYLELMLRLEIDIYSAGCDGNFCAIFAAMSATFPYDKAIDQTARTYPNEHRDRVRPSHSPTSMPRPLLAHLWGPRYLVASGNPTEDLVLGVVNGLEALLKEFFTDYVNANRK